MECQNNLVRIAVVGAAGVGKSALTVRLMTGRFLHHYDPTLEDEYSTSLMVDGEEREIIILDTAGQDNEHLYDYSYSSNVLLVAFSLADLSSLQHAKQIVSQASNKMVSIVLVGTKTDLKSERQVSREAALSVSNNLGCPYLETSAASGFNVHHLYQLAVRLVLADFRKARLTRSLEVEKNFCKARVTRSLEVEKKQQKSKPFLSQWSSVRYSTSLAPSVVFLSTL